MTATNQWQPTRQLYDDLVAGTRVRVRNAFGAWSPGFRIVAHDGVGYHVARISDGWVLPKPFDRQHVRADESDVARAIDAGPSTVCPVCTSKVPLASGFGTPPDRYAECPVCEATFRVADGEVPHNDGVRVLIVDDLPEARLLIREALTRREGMSVVGQARTGEEAIAMSEQLQPDVVVLDLRMPTMDGITALPEIRRVAPDAQIIVESIYPIEDKGDEVRRLGADAYIEKLSRGFAREVAETVASLCA